MEIHPDPPCQVCDNEIEMRSCTCSCQYQPPENPTRGNWHCAGHCTLAMLGVVFGYYDVSTFPYIVFVNRGAITLIVYTLIVLFMIIPTIYICLSLGQFTSSGVLTCWPVPIFKGLGAAIIASASIFVIYYTVIGAYSSIYIYVTLDSVVKGTELPWKSHDAFREYSPGCYNSTAHLLTPQESPTNYDENDDQGYSYNYNGEDGDQGYPYNAHNVTQTDKRSLVEVFFSCHVAVQESIAGDCAAFNGEAAVGLLVMWIVIALAVIFGVKVLGWVISLMVVCVTLLLLVLTIRSVSLPGASVGLRYLFDLELLKYSEAKSWESAVLLAVFSWLPMSGLFITFASYNRFHNNFVRDIIIVFILKYVLMILGCVTLFSFYGFLAYKKDIHITDVASSGFGAVIVLTEVFNNIPVSGLWVILYFVMILLMVCMQGFAQVEIIVTGIVDQFPTLRKWRPLGVTVLCVTFFLLGLPLISKTGLELLTVVDLFNQVSGLVLIIMLGVCIVTYGVLSCFAHRHDVAVMARYDLLCIPAICAWSFTTVCFLLSLIVICWVLWRVCANLSPDYYPSWTQNGLLECIVSTVCVVMVITTIIQILVATICKKPPIRDLFRISWRPVSDNHARLADIYRQLNPHSCNNYNYTVEIHQLLDNSPQIPDSSPQFQSNSPQFEDSSPQHQDSSPPIFDSSPAPAYDTVVEATAPPYDTKI